MSTTSMIYTVGTALDRAQQHDSPVQLLVEGQWLEGHVVATDGHGVVLDLAGLEHSVVRMERIAAVRVQAAAPMRDEATTRLSIGRAGGSLVHG